MLEEVAGHGACSNGLILNSLGWVGVRTKVAPLSYRSVNSIWSHVRHHGGSLTKNIPAIGKS